MTADYTDYSAWIDAGDPVNAIRTWPRITLLARGTYGRRERAASINALKRAIERHAWTTAHGEPMTVRLDLDGKKYSETPGFLHASYFTYTIERITR